MKKERKLVILSRVYIFPHRALTLQMDLNICTVSLGAHDVTIEVRCRAQPLPHNPLVQIPTVTLNDLEVASFVFGSHWSRGRRVVITERGED